MQTDRVLSTPRNCWWYQCYPIAEPECWPNGIPVVTLPMLLPPPAPKTKRRFEFWPLVAMTLIAIGWLCFDAWVLTWSWRK